MASCEEWDRRFLDMAVTIARSSKDPSTRVGAVIADQENRLVSAGYNGFPRGVIDAQERLADRSIRLLLTVHAEKNAILFARRDLRGCTLYSTFAPCASCSSLIIQAGITRVVSPEPPPEFRERWKDDLTWAARMFFEAHVDQDLIKICPKLLGMLPR